MFLQRNQKEEKTMQAATKSIHKDKNQITECRVYVRPEDEKDLAEKMIGLLLESFLYQEVCPATEE